MAETTNIGWTDTTVNFWWGCTKVSPGCDHCYAETLAKRFGHHVWGPGVERHKIKSADGWMRKLQAGASKFYAKHGRQRWVFMQSMSDAFDNDVPGPWRTEMFTAIDACPDLQIQLLTKRVGNVERLAPAHWSVASGWPRHVGLMITVVNQAEADRDIPKLLELKAKYNIAWVGLSMEPLLGPVDITSIARKGGTGLMRPLDGRFAKIDWVIYGGESGSKARPMHPDWARGIRDQCEAAGVPHHFKQWGSWMDMSDIEPKPVCIEEQIFTPSNEVVGIGVDYGRHGSIDPDWREKGAAWMGRVKPSVSGSLLDGVEHKGMPEVRG